MFVLSLRVVYLLVVVVLLCVFLVCLRCIAEVSTIVRCAVVFFRRVIGCCFCSCLLFACIYDPI